MVCVYCGDKTHVTNSRPKKRTHTTWRRRECDSCKNIFTTVETVDFAGSVAIIYPDGVIRPFQRDILYLSVYDSLRHRKDAASAATALTDTVLGRLLPSIENAGLNRQDIVISTKKVLEKFDKAAGVYYGAYHPVG